MGADSRQVLNDHKPCLRLLSRSAFGEALPFLLTLGGYYWESLSDFRELV
jgi:hypothetical protein